MGGLKIFGAIAAAIGLALDPVFLTSAIFGIAAHTDPHGFTVRFWAGLGEDEMRHIHMGGNVLSAAGWDANGGWLGSDHKHGHSIDAGGFRDIHVHTHATNVRAEYVAIAAQPKDAICLAGLSITYPDSTEPLVVLGDVFATCGMPWY